MKSDTNADKTVSDEKPQAHTKDLLVARQVCGSHVSMRPPSKTSARRWRPSTSSHQANPTSVESHEFSETTPATVGRPSAGTRNKRRKSHQRNRHGISGDKRASRAAGRGGG